MASESNKFLLTSEGESIPIGTFTWWFGLETQIPEGWLKLDGSEFSLTDYPKLYAVLGTNVLPNVVDRFIMGGDVGQSLDSAAASGSTYGIISAIPIIKAGTKGTNLIYTNDEIDTLFSTLEERVTALETGTSSSENNESAHETSLDAHDELFAEKASTTSAAELTSSVDTLEGNVAELAALIEQKENETE